MRTLSRSIVVFTIVAFAAVITGCGGGGGDQATTDHATTGTAEPAATGSLSVNVSYDGEIPEPEMVDASANPECNTDEIKKQSVKVSDGKLQDVVVAVESGPSGYETSASEDVMINQKNCKYHPHVEAVKTGQTVMIKDSDPDMHNVRATQDGRQLFNETTFEGGSFEKTFDEAGTYKLECNVHPWMSAFLYVTDHGKASVTDESGMASLSGLPEGDYEITLWHEKLGTKTQSVTVNEDEEATLDVTFSG